MKGQTHPQALNGISVMLAIIIDASALVSTRHGHFGERWWAEVFLIQQPSYGRRLPLVVGNRCALGATGLVYGCVGFLFDCPFLVEVFEKGRHVLLIDDAMIALSMVDKRAYCARENCGKGLSDFVRRF